MPEDKDSLTFPPELSPRRRQRIKKATEMEMMFH
jgi:hypothetical protein